MSSARIEELQLCPAQHLRCHVTLIAMLGRLARGMQCCSFPYMRMRWAGVAPAGWATAGTAAQHLNADMLLIQQTSCLSPEGVI